MHSIFFIIVNAIFVVLVKYLFHDVGKVLTEKQQTAVNKTLYIIAFNKTNYRF